MKLNHFLQRREDDIHVLADSLGAFVDAHKRYDVARIAAELANHDEPSMETMNDCNEHRKDACAQILEAFERLMGVELMVVKTAAEE
jgi:hypothetical protein